MKKIMLLAFVAAVPFANASVLWDNGHADADGYFSDAYSANGSYFYAQTMADNFSLGSDSTISGITFWGSSENFQFPDMTNMPQIEVDIFDSSFNLIHSGTVTGASGVATGGVNGLGGNEYEFTYTGLGSLAAGDYRISVGGILLDPGADAFAWSNGSNDLTLYANFFDGNGFGEYTDTGDLAFRIDGDPVPEPASMAVLGLGAAALLRRRKK